MMQVMGHPTLTEEGATRLPRALRLPESPRELSLQVGSLSSAPAAPSGCPVRVGAPVAHAGQRGQNKSRLCSRAGRRSQPAWQPHGTLHSQSERRW